MALIIKNSKNLIDPANLKLTILVFGNSGLGKTSLLGTVPGIGIAAIETGIGAGLASIADLGVDYVTPENYDQVKEVTDGKVFKDHSAIGIDSLTAMERRIIKDKALSLPRTRGESLKRQIGIPELDDYGSMAELTTARLEDLLSLDKHIIVTALEKVKQPDENGKGSYAIGPDLPGSMFTTAPGMFDIVLRLRARTKLADPKDAKSKYVERYFETAADGQDGLVKSRFNRRGFSFLPKELVFDLATGSGGFPDILRRIKEGFAKVQATQA